MDNTTARDAQGSTPCSIHEIVALGHQLSTRLLSCSLDSGLKRRCDLIEVHSAVAANTSTLAELQGLLVEAHEPAVVNDEGKRSVLALAHASRQVYQTLTLVLLKASTEDHPDEADFGTTDKPGLVQELTSRRLATVVRECWVSWLRPRVLLCGLKLQEIGLDLMLHLYLFKLARHQLSPPQNITGRFEEELALRAFAERWLSHLDQAQRSTLKARQKRYRLRTITDDKASECDEEIVEIGTAGAKDDAEDAEQKHSETASDCSTIVDVVVSVTPEKEQKEKKTQENSPSNSPSSATDFTKKDEQPKTSVGKSDRPPRGFKRLFAPLSLRIKSLFSNDAAMLKRLGYHQANPQLEAWITGPMPNSFIAKLPLRSDQVVQQLRQEVQKGINPSWDNALTVFQGERDAIEDVRGKAMLSDLRLRTCVYVSERRSDLGTNVFEAPGLRRVVYLAVDKEVETIFLTDPDGDELQVPLLKHRFWANILIAYLMKEQPKGPMNRHLIHTSRYDLVAEDGRVFSAQGQVDFAKPGERFTIVTRGPRPPGHFVGLPPPPHRYVPSVSSSSSGSSVDDTPNWEIDQELSLWTTDPMDSSDDEEKTVKVPDLLARLTNAPDADFDTGVAEGVLGPMDDDSDDDSNDSSSMSTID